MIRALGFLTRSRSGSGNGRPRIHFDGEPDFATWRTLEDPDVRDTSDPRIVAALWGVAVGLLVSWLLWGFG